MTIKQVMALGTEGLTAVQMQEELERRMAIVHRINKLGAQMANADTTRKSELKKRLNHIKADENVWLRKAAWFLY